MLSYLRASVVQLLANSLRHDESWQTAAEAGPAQNPSAAFGAGGAGEEINEYAHEAETAVRLPASPE
jgi:hypothetical protein